MCLSNDGKRRWVACISCIVKNRRKEWRKKQKKLDDISKKFGDEREKALNDALKLIEKDFGKGSIMRLGETCRAKGTSHEALVP